MFGSLELTVSIVSEKGRDQRQLSNCISYSFHPRSGELLTQTFKSHLVITQSLDVLPIKPEVSQYIAIHVLRTARDFFLAYFYPFGPFTCIFSKPLPISHVLAVLTHGSCVGPQNKIGHPVECMFPC